MGLRRVRLELGGEPLHEHLVDHRLHVRSGLGVMVEATGELLHALLFAMSHEFETAGLVDVRQEERDACEAPKRDLP